MRMTRILGNLSLVPHQREINNEIKAQDEYNGHPLVLEEMLQYYYVFMRSIVRLLQSQEKFRSFLLELLFSGSAEKGKVWEGY